MSDLRVGKRLQLAIAAADDVTSMLRPLRAKRSRRNVKVAAGVGGATSAVVGGALLAANIGFWSSVGVALGLGSIPLLIIAGAGGLSLGPQKKKQQREDPDDYEKERERAELTFACFSLMADADGRISDEERVLLRSVLLQYPLSEEDQRRIEEAEPSEILAQADRFDEGLRQQVLQGAWMLAEADGTTEEEEECFSDLGQKLGCEGDIRQLKKQSRALQMEMNDLVTAMFRVCQQILSPSLGQPTASEFLEALALIAATPAVRRSLRNSLTSGFSAGGVIQALNQPAIAAKCVAQACNAIRSVYGRDGEERKAGERRLFDLAEASEVGQREARRICADVEALFEELSADEQAG